MPCVLVYQKDPALLIALLGVFPDKKTQTCEEQHHETDRHYPCDNHIVEKHDGLLLVSVCVGARLTTQAGAYVDRDQ